MFGEHGVEGETIRILQFVRICSILYCGTAEKYGRATSFTTMAIGILGLGRCRTMGNHSPPRNNRIRNPVVFCSHNHRKFRISPSVSAGFVVYYSIIPFSKNRKGVSP